MNLPLPRQSSSCWHSPHYSLFPRLRESCRIPWLFPDDQVADRVCQQHFQKANFFLFFFFPPSLTAHILLAIPGALLTQAGASCVFRVRSCSQVHRPKFSTWLKEEHLQRAAAIREGDLMQGKRVSSSASLCVAMSNLLLRDLKSVLVSAGQPERSRSAAPTDGEGTSAALLSPHKLQRGFFNSCCGPEGLSPLLHTDCSLKCDKIPQSKL